MATVGYARVSTAEQDLTIQNQVLKEAGCKKIFSEKVSGTSKKGRNQLKACLDYLREGDTLVITRVDRLARSMHDLQNIIHHLKSNNIALKATEQPIDTSTPAGKAFFDMLGVFAEFETNLRKERQLEGIEKAKKEGKYKGRQPTPKNKEQKIMELFNQGIHKTEIANQVSVGIATVYRIIKKNKVILRPKATTANNPETLPKTINSTPLTSNDLPVNTHKNTTG